MMLNCSLLSPGYEYEELFRMFCTSRTSRRFRAEFANNSQISAKIGEFLKPGEKISEK